MKSHPRRHVLDCLSQQPNIERAQELSLRRNSDILGWLCRKNVKPMLSHKFMPKNQIVNSRKSVTAIILQVPFKASAHIGATGPPYSIPNILFSTHRKASVRVRALSPHLHALALALMCKRSFLASVIDWVPAAHTQTNAPVHGAK